ncbi:helix-turn-helix transcriptional regulator [Hydrogenophaga intermedia]|uniref:helix-turn-helix transcriptional regulator n=1 Tax=Hydrogenophaga intermedia TaxID=65786 RepID=UPI003340E0FD
MRTTESQTAMYLTAPEVAGLLRISLRSLYTYVREHRVPAPIWLGGKRLWPAQSVHDALGAASRRRRR